MCFFPVTELESFDTSSVSKFLSHAYFCVILSFSISPFNPGPFPNFLMCVHLLIAAQTSMALVWAILLIGRFVSVFRHDTCSV